MSDPDAPPLDTRRLVATLGRHEVGFVIVGGIAGIAHGVGMSTFDIDIVPAFTDENLRRLGAALEELGANLRVDGLEEPVPFELSPAAFRQFEVSTWRTDAGDLDVIVGIPTAEKGRLATFDQLVEHALERRAFGVTILVADLDDVIASKVALGRPSDLAVLPAFLARRRALEDDLGLDL